MLATLRGFTAVPHQGAQDGSGKKGQPKDGHNEDGRNKDGQNKPAQNTGENAVLSGVLNGTVKGMAIVPLIKRRHHHSCREGIGVLLPPGPATRPALWAERRHRIRQVGRASRSDRAASRQRLPCSPPQRSARATGPGPSCRTWQGCNRWLLKPPQAAPWAEHLSAGLATGLGIVLAAGLCPGWANPLQAEPAPRPVDLKILVETTNMREGTHWLGVYGRVAELDQPGLWRVKLWREWSDRVEITTESIDCRPGRATRAGVTASKVVVQTLNPGGPINPANRLDHLIWWATCFPEQAGRDPAKLAPLARSLGFDGHQREQFEVLSVPPLPHP